MLKQITGGVCAAQGFRAAGLHVGVKTHKVDKKDVALIVSDTDCAAAAVFTKNVVKAAPIHVTKAHLADGKATPIISMCFVILILSRITSTGSLLIRSTVCIMAYLVIITVGYVIFVLFCSLYGGETYSTFTFFMSPGPFRVMFKQLESGKRLY